MTRGPDGDDRDEEPMMQSMRSVWLSMRDEEPSSKGLDALLAAARSKAVEMKPAPSWWQSLFATLRRPPVLAFATVIIVIGGAALIRARRADTEVTAEPPPAVAPAPQPSITSGMTGAEEATPRPKAPEPQKQAGTSADSGGLEQPRKEAERPRETPRRPVPSVNAGLGSAAPPPVVKHGAPPDTQEHAPAKDPEKHREQQGTGGTSGGGTSGDDHVKAPLPGVVAEVATVTATSTGDKKKPSVDSGKPGRLEIADEDGDRSGSRPGAAEMKPDAHAPVVKSTTTAKPPRGPSSDQLIQQTETAAARGDCTAVRVMADRIKKTDAAAYKARVEKNAAISRCLAK